MKGTDSLRERAEFLKLATQADGEGGFTRSYTSAGTRACAILGLPNASMQSLADRYFSGRAVTIVVRKDSLTASLTDQDRATVRGRDYEIIGVLSGTPEAPMNRQFITLSLHTLK